MECHPSFKIDERATQQNTSGAPCASVGDRSSRCTTSWLGRPCWTIPLYSMIARDDKMIITMTFPQGTPLHPREIGRPHSAGLCRRVHICGLVAERSKVARGNRYSHFGLRLLIGLYVAGAISLVLLLSSKFDVDRLIAIERLDRLTKIVPPEDTVYNIKNATVTFRVPTNAADSVGLPIQPNATGYITVVLSLILRSELDTTRECHYAVGQDESVFPGAESLVDCFEVYFLWTLESLIRPLNEP